MEDQVARQLEEKVPDEEHARAGPVDHLAELQLFEHLQLREADIDAIEIRHDVAEHQERHEAPRHLAVDGVFCQRRGSGTLNSHWTRKAACSISSTDARPDHRRCRISWTATGDRAVETRHAR